MLHFIFGAFLARDMLNCLWQLKTYKGGEIMNIITKKIIKIQREYPKLVKTEVLKSGAVLKTYEYQRVIITYEN